jgi:hypothetical protein
MNISPHNHTFSGQVQWLMPVILATWEVKMERITVQGQPWQKASEIPSQPIKAGYASDLHGECK